MLNNAGTSPSMMVDPATGSNELLPKMPGYFPPNPALQYDTPTGSGGIAPPGQRPSPGLGGRGLPWMPGYFGGMENRGITGPEGPSGSGRGRLPWMPGYFGGMERGTGLPYMPSYYGTSGYGPGVSRTMMGGWYPPQMGFMFGGGGAPGYGAPMGINMDALRRMLSGGTGLPGNNTGGY